MALQLNTNSRLEDTDPTHIYIDLSIVNNDWDGNEGPKSLIFNEIRNSPYLLQPNKYFFSVVRFELDTPSLPVFVPLIETNQPDVNKTVYKIGITYAGGEYTATIYWESNIFPAPVPSGGVGARQVASPYYYGFTYTNFLEKINNTLLTLFNSISGKPTGILPPRFSYDENQNRMQFQADCRYFINGATSIAPTTAFSIYVNGPLYKLLSGFDWYDFGMPITNAYMNPLQYRLRVYETLNNLQFRKSPPGALTTVFDVIMTSEQLDIALWNPVKSLVFSSGLIPISPTLTSPPKSATGVALTSYGNNSNLSSQLTDFEVPFTPNNTYKNTVNYNPTSEYRLIDVLSDIPLNAIDVSVFWKDIYGNLNPFTLASGCNASIKLMFRRKDFNNTEYMNR